MRNYVQRVFVGKGVAFKPLDTLAENEIVAFDWDTKLVCTADTTVVGLKMGANKEFVVGPMSSTLRRNNLFSQFRAGVESKVQAKVLTVPAAGQEAMFKVIIHDNLSIIPNQIKQIFASVVGIEGETVGAFATRVVDALNVAQNGEYGTRKVFVAEVAAPGDIINVISYKDDAYNGIDRPEKIYLELGVPAVGTYNVLEFPGMHPNGLGIQVMWLEDLHQGRYGFSDRTNWNSKKYPHSATEDGEYDIYSINANIAVEGDMQDLRFNPVGVILALNSADDNSPLIDELALAKQTFKNITSYVAP